jgi:DNA-binding MarR family transcriptional regulator
VRESAEETTTATPTAEREDFDAAWDEFFAAIRRARGRAAAEIEKEGLSLAQFQLLYAFADRGGAESLSVGALAEAAGVAQPTATRMLDALERAEAIERRPSKADRRSVAVHLTPKGRRALNRKRKLVAAKRKAVYESLPAGDRKRAAELLRRFADAFEEA